MRGGLRHLPATLDSVRSRIEYLRADLLKQRRVHPGLARRRPVPSDGPLPTAELCPLMRVRGVRVVDGATVVTLSCGHELIPGDVRTAYTSERYRCRRCGRGDVVERQGRLFG